MRPPLRPAKIAKYAIVGVATLLSAVAFFFMGILGAVAGYAIGYSQVQGALVAMVLIFVRNVSFVF